MKSKLSLFIIDNKYIVILFDKYIYINYRELYFLNMMPNKKIKYLLL